MQNIELSANTAHLLGLAFASLYVGSIYVSKEARLVFASGEVADSLGKGPARERAREVNERWRDDPDVIKARLVAVSAATVLCVSIVCYITRSFSTALSLLGLWPTLPTSPSSLYYTITPHIVTPILFLGPLYAAYLGTLSATRSWSLGSYFRGTFFTLSGVRNYVIAPITEEIVFRACILAVYLLSPELSASKTGLIMITPLNFGVAHLHHAWDQYNRFGRTRAALKRAVIVSLFQMTYTALFGAHCAYLFLQTRRSILVPIVAHVFCNLMGLPDFSGDLRTGRMQGKEWSVKAAYLLGIVGFAFSVMPMGRWWST